MQSPKKLSSRNKKKAVHKSKSKSVAKSQDSIESTSKKVEPDKTKGRFIDPLSGLDTLSQDGLMFQDARDTLANFLRELEYWGGLSDESKYQLEHEQFVQNPFETVQTDKIYQDQVTLVFWTTPSKYELPQIKLGIRVTAKTTIENIQHAWDWIRGWRESVSRYNFKAFGHDFTSPEDWVAEWDNQRKERIPYKQIAKQVQEEFERLVSTAIEARLDFDLEGNGGYVEVDDPPLYLLDEAKTLLDAVGYNKVETNELVDNAIADTNEGRDLLPYNVQIEIAKKIKERVKARRKKRGKNLKK